MSTAPGRRRPRSTALGRAAGCVLILLGTGACGTTKSSASPRSDAAAPSDAESTMPDATASNLCTGVSCHSAPASYCVDAKTARRYAATGSCSGGACSYVYTDALCATACTNGSCGASDPCTGVACTAAPAPVCTDATTLQAYSPSGTCSGGTCSYTSTTTTCPAGCANGACNPATGPTDAGGDAPSDSGACSGAYQSLCGPTCACGAGYDCDLATGTCLVGSAEQCGPGSGTCANGEACLANGSIVDAGFGSGVASCCSVPGTVGCALEADGGLASYSCCYGSQCDYASGICQGTLLSPCSADEPCYQQLACDPAGSVCRLPYAAACGGTECFVGLGCDDSTNTCLVVIGGSCAGGRVCAQAPGVQVDGGVSFANIPSQCNPTTETCVACGKGVACQKDSDCCGELKCNGTANTCVACGSGATCQKDADCCGGLSCIAGSCGTSCTPEGQSCGGSTCCAGLSCTAGTCTAAACTKTGQPCTSVAGCCSGQVCQSPAPGSPTDCCYPSGSACQSAFDCCSQNCMGSGVCG